MTDKKEILKINGLTKVYADQKEAAKVIDNLNLSVDKKEFLCILGPSGCGKTTLLRCIAGFEKYEGDIIVDGEKKTEPGTDRLMVFQDYNQLFAWKTVKGNIQYPLKLKGIKDKKKLDEITKEVLHKVKLDGYENYYPFQLSGGMKQRVAIAKALALKPQIILMDEPFAALDAMTRNELQAEMVRIHEEENSTVIFITHNIQEAIVLGSRLIVLKSGGQIVLDEKNSLKKPVTPSTPGYGEVWDRFHSALY